MMTAMFRDMFHSKADQALVGAIAACVRRLPRALGEKCNPGDATT
jgi:hypothetical protein